MKKEKGRSIAGITIIVITITLLLTSGCWGRKYFTAKFTTVKTMPEGKALVYIYRPKNFVGSAVHFSVHANDRKVSDVHLYNGGYIVYFADPGKYEFWAQVSNTRTEILVDIEAGKTYYIEGESVKLELVPNEIGEQRIKKCKLLRYTK